MPRHVIKNKDELADLVATCLKDPAKTAADYLADDRLGLSFIEDWCRTEAAKGMVASYELEYHPPRPKNKEYGHTQYGLWVRLGFTNCAPCVESSFHDERLVVIYMVCVRLIGEDVLYVDELHDE